MFDLNYLSGSLEYSLAHSALYLGRRLIFEMVGDPIRLYKRRGRLRSSREQSGRSAARRRQKMALFNATGGNDLADFRSRRILHRERMSAFKCNCGSAWRALEDVEDDPKEQAARLPGERQQWIINFLLKKQEIA
jgi:hypothetical protein